mmetsp:Transcript_16280/g.48488  ORF Transcript_16280/g.48488 Transcript_16280/m.48488 type:complete len:289 (+) Transcript_16280:71-937(+)
MIVCMVTGIHPGCMCTYQGPPPASHKHIHAHACACVCAGTCTHAWLCAHTRVFLQLHLQPLQQAQSVCRGAGKPSDDAVADAPHLLGIGLHDGRSQADLAISDQHDLVALSYAQNGGAMVLAQVAMPGGHAGLAAGIVPTRLLHLVRSLVRPPLVLLRGVSAAAGAARAWRRARAGRRLRRRCGRGGCWHAHHGSWLSQSVRVAQIAETVAGRHSPDGRQRRRLPASHGAEHVAQRRHGRATWSGAGAGRRGHRHDPSRHETVRGVGRVGELGGPHGQRTPLQQRCGP